MSKKSILGTGLTELLSSVQGLDGNNAKPGAELKQLSIDLLKPGKFQPRMDIKPESLHELAETIKAQGIIQPLVVRPLTEGYYEIIAGERRWRAAQLVGLVKVPVVVRKLKDQEAMAFSLIENIQREDLNVIDTAAGLQRLVSELQLTHEQVAKLIGKSRTLVTNLLRILSLPLEVKRLIENNQLEMGHARALLGLKSIDQMALAKKVVKNSLSVRVTEQLAKRLKAGSATLKDKNKLVFKNELNHLQRQLSDRLAASVELRATKKGKGKIIIHYNNLDELDGILSHIK